MKSIKLIILLALTSFVSRAQTPIEVTENTFKVSGLGEEVFYFGFAEGDKMVFNFEEANGKDLKEIEIIEYPSASKFMDYKTSKIENKTITVYKTSVYKFRFANAALGGRVCKVKIMRIPANETTKGFNSSVYWHDVHDTTYTDELEQYIARIDTSIVSLANTNILVHSVNNSEGNRERYNISIPPNALSWSYYIGVDQEGEQAFQSGLKSFKQVGSPLISKIPGYGGLAALALEGISFFTQLTKGENINYCITDVANSNLFAIRQPYKYIKGSSVINDFSQMSAYSTPIHFCFENDNYIQPVRVYLHAEAICINKQIATRPVRRMQVKTHNEPYMQP